MDEKMTLVPKLNLGFRDAENYKQKDEKEVFNQIFLRTPDLDRLCASSTSFLIGEKGTGKTAYAIYMSNINYNNTCASLKFIRETEYEKFVALKKANHLTLSDYSSIWKVIIYLLLSQQIKERESQRSFIGHFKKFDDLTKAIDKFYNSAFSPEISSAMYLAEQSSLAAELIWKYAKLGGEEKNTFVFTQNRFQTNLLFIQRHFEDAIKSLKLSQNYLLFLDGIDKRSEIIDYPTYLECIKGLANAVWAINNDFFAGIKGSKGRLRVVLLVRPDIFNSLGLQNQNSKIQDNSVVLNWITTYLEYRNSALFQLTERLLSYQQKSDKKFLPGDVWSYYFPYNTRNLEINTPFPSSFITFMRYSFYRPRDIITMLSIQKDIFIEQKRPDSSVFSENDFSDPAFTRKYSQYALGEVRDHIDFYYSKEDYESLLKFFQYLNGHSRFNYEEYLGAFKNYISFMEKNRVRIPDFCNSPDNFLQFLYDLNILSYLAKTETGDTFFGWCFRERDTSNIAPKIRTHVDYEIHYSLMKALDLGKRFLVDYNSDH